MKKGFGVILLCFKNENFWLKIETLHVGIWDEFGMVHLDDVFYQFFSTYC